MVVKVLRLKQCAVAISFAALVSGCASGARPEAMTAPVSASNIIESSSSLHNAIQIGKVTGGSDTNPLWMSNVSDDDFKKALQQSLVLQAIAANEASRYTLDAELVSLEQPFAGFDLTVTANVHYKVARNVDESLALDETVSTPYTANFTDAFAGYERLRLANEGAVRENIKAILAKLKAAAQPGGALAQ